MSAKNWLAFNARRLRALIGRPIVVRQKQTVIEDAIAPCPNPIFVIGVHRSGTSLLRRILNSHPAIACPPETFFLTHMAAMFRDPLTESGFDGLGYAKDEFLSEMRRTAFRYHEAFRLGEGKPRWADKTPQYVDIAPDLAALAPEGAVFLMIFRDPFDIATSILNRGWRLGEHAADPLENTARYVADKVGRMIRFRDTGGARVVTVRYEDIVAAPEAELRRLVEALGEEWDARVLAPWRQAHNFGAEDPAVRGLKAFVPSVGNYRRLSPGQQAVLEAELGDLRRALGYGGAAGAVAGSGAG